MLHIRQIGLLAAAVLLWSTDAAISTAQIRQATKPDKKTEQAAERRLINVLKSDASLHDKAVACQLLAVVGSKDAVPVLAGLLSNEKLSHYARFGLEPIEDPAVDEVLRRAAKSLKGNLLIGVINSIGNRKDVQAVDDLKKLLSASDGNVVAAAAAALSRIGNTQSARILVQTLESGSAESRPAVGDACLKCAERLSEQGDRQAAAAVYARLRKADVPKQQKLAATFQAILVDQASSIPLLVEQLKSNDEDFFKVALRASRFLTGSNVTQALLGELEKLPDNRKAALIIALGDRGEGAALPVALDAAKAQSPVLRLAGIRALAKLSDPSATRVLLNAAVLAENPSISQAAQDGLVALQGRGVDRQILAQLNQSEGESRRIIIDVIGRRRIESAVPALLKASDDAEPRIRQAAIIALGETVHLDGITMLTNRLTSAKTPAETSAAQTALVAACLRMSDKDASTAKVVESMASLPVKSKILLLDVLGQVGGDTALDAVYKSARDPSDEIQDNATRVLGLWMSPDVGPKLLELAKNHPSEKYRIRVMRGYIRIARQLGVTNEERDAMCRQAMQVAERDEEKKLIMEALSRYPSHDGLVIVASQLDSPTLKNDAISRALGIAEIIVGDNPETVARVARQVLKLEPTGKSAERAQALLAEAEKKSK